MNWDSNRVSIYLFTTQIRFVSTIHNFLSRLWSLYELYFLPNLFSGLVSMLQFSTMIETSIHAYRLNLRNISFCLNFWLMLTFSNIIWNGQEETLLKDTKIFFSWKKITIHDLSLYFWHGKINFAFLHETRRF